MGAQSVKLYLGTWCMYMYILHLQSRCTETDSEYFLLDQCYALFICKQVLASERGGGGRGQRGRTSPSPLGKTPDTGTCMLNVKVCGYFIVFLVSGMLTKQVV